jgi:hypothetical protein
MDHGWCNVCEHGEIKEKIIGNPLRPGIPSMEQSVKCSILYMDDLPDRCKKLANGEVEGD